MKFAICNETFQDPATGAMMPFDEAFALARECGYTGIEIAPFTVAKDVKDIPTEQRTTIRQQAEAAGLEVIGLHWLLAFTEGYYLTSPEEEVRQRTSEYVKELARLCNQLGGRVLVFGSPKQRNLLPGISHEQGMEYAADVFKAAMPVLEELDVVLAVEPLGPGEGDFLRTAALGVELCEMVDSPNCRLHLDTKAMSSEEIPIPEIIRQCAPHLEHFHANDPNMLGPGMGDLDFVPIFQALKEVGYDGWISVEVFDYQPGAEHIARESMRYMLECFEKLAQ